MKDATNPRVLEVAAANRAVVEAAVRAGAERGEVVRTLLEVIGAGMDAGDREALERELMRPEEVSPAE